jgi:ferric enterobactin receptor
MRKLVKALLVLLLLQITQLSFAQEKVISGVVLGDEDNAPLKDVTVSVKGTNSATKTNQVGYFSLKAQKNQVLVFTFVDYVRKEVVVGDNNQINVKLVQLQKQLGEVVVSAYGIKKNRREAGTPMQEIKGEDVADTRRENFMTALSGRIPGLMVSTSSGAPGASTQIMLRGATSIDGNNQPLLVVDGVPYDNQTLNQENIVGGGANRNSDYGNRGADINPEDIESITILKGPEASALYGSDGASGALIITTKKGIKGKASVYFDNSFKWEKVDRFPETQKVYGRGTNGISNNASTANLASISSTLFLRYFGEKYAPETPLYDNIKNFFQIGHTQNSNLSVEGGSDITTYRLSTNYINQSGIIPNTGFNKLSVKLNGSVKIASNANLSSSMTYTKTKTQKAPKGMGAFYLNLLTWPADDDVRNWITEAGGRRLIRGTDVEYDNPFWDVYKNTSTDKSDRLVGNTSLNIDLFPWWNVGGTIGLDYYTQIGDQYYHPDSRLYFGSGYYSIYEQTTRNISGQLRSMFKKKIGSFNNTLLVGFSNDNNRTEIQSQDGKNLYEKEFHSINNTLLSSRSSMASVIATRKTRFFGNYTLAYKNSAYLSLAGSSEGNSTFMSSIVDKNPFYNFGSATLSWIVSDLAALENITWLNYAKTRISYGTTGKGPASPYMIDPKFTNSTLTGGGYFLGTTAANYGLKPEFTSNLEFGAELKLFGNKLSLDITRYELKSKDQIISARVSYGTGAVLKTINGGEVTNKGIEVLATVEPIKTKRFSWRSTFSFARNRGTITQMPSGLPTYYNSDTWVAGNIRSQMFVGAPNGNLAGFISARNTNGDLLINTSTGLPTYIAESFASIGNRSPDWTGGWVNRFSYKDFLLSFTLDIRKGGEVFNGNEFVLYHIGLSARTLDRDKLVIYKGVLQDGMQNTSTPTKNTIMINPMTVDDYYFSVSANPESQFVETVNWLRMRDITLSYSLPTSALKRIKPVQAASFFVSGTDLFMLTNYSGADPSVSVNNASARGYGGSGIDFGSMAVPRGFNVGCKVNF